MQMHVHQKSFKRPHIQLGVLDLFFFGGGGAGALPQDSLLGLCFALRRTHTVVSMCPCCVGPLNIDSMTSSNLQLPGYLQNRQLFFGNVTRDVKNDA